MSNPALSAIAARTPIASAVRQPNSSTEVDAAAPAVSAAPSTSTVDQPGAVAENKKEDPAAIQNAVNDLNAAMKQRSSSIEFSIDEDSGKTILKVTDTESKTVLAQYPCREALAIAKQIDEFQGMFVRTKA